MTRVPHSPLHPSTADEPSRLALCELHRGMSFGYLARPGYFASAAAEQAVQAMCANGVKWVALMVTVMQQSFASTRVFSDFEFTVSDSELRRIIDRLHHLGLRVMMKPMVECLDSAWRGRITFPDGDQQIQGRRSHYWDDWFSSYRSALIHYARIAEETKCEIFSVGCELVGTDAQSLRWNAVVTAIRQVYAGPLTYDAQPSSVLDDSPPEWFSSLDLIGCSFYQSAASRPNASLEEMIDTLRPTVARFARAAELIRRPVIFAEAGCRSASGAAILPSAYADSQSYSGDEQANYLEAFCRLFWKEPWWRGFYWWKWDEQQRREHYLSDPKGNMGFTLEGKPAAAVLARWFARTDR